MHMHPVSNTLTLRERRNRRFLLLAYPITLFGLNLGWEIVQLPLYTLAQEPLPTIAFAIVHCTAGDVLIGVSSLVLAALIARSTCREPPYAEACVVAVAIGLGVGYTVFSEWLNVHVKGSWAYSALMPTLPGLGTGLSPLLQWMVVPPLAMRLAWGLSRAL